MLKKSIAFIFCLLFAGCSSGSEKLIAASKGKDTVTISGHVRWCDESPSVGVLMVADGFFPKLQGRKIVNKPYRRETYTNENGFYQMKFPLHWSGKVRATKDGYVFEGIVDGRTSYVCQ